VKEKAKEKGKIVLDGQIRTLSIWFKKGRGEQVYRKTISGGEPEREACLEKGKSRKRTR